MTQKKPMKSTFSIILQDALQDATPEQRDKINEVLKFADAAFCKKVDDRYNARMYSDESISFNRIPTYNDPKGGALDALDGTEAIIFTALCRGLVRGNLIASSKKELAEITGISRPTVGKAIDSLVRNGYLAIQQPPSGKRTQTIWMLNPLCIGNGKLLYKSLAVEAFEALAGAETMARFYSKKRKWQAVGQTIDTPVGKLNYSVIMPYTLTQEKEKEPSDAPTPNSSNKPITNDKIITSNQTAVKKPRNGKSRKPRDWSTYPDDLPGQMNMSDYAAIPSDVNDPGLPFNQA